MKTGIVVNNYDPLFKNRCQIRVNGIHTQKINGRYVILDDDLPWALPAPNSTNNNGNYSVPKVGERVYVDVKDNYNINYYSTVEIKGNVKDILYDHADTSDRVKVIAFAEDYKNDGTVEHMKIYFIPDEGLTIEYNDNVIRMPKYNEMEIKTKGGAGISIDTVNNDVTIHSDSAVNLHCNNINLTEEAEEKLILGTKLMEKFNNHKHFTSDGQSSKPIQQITVDDFSKKIKIG